MKTNKTKAQLLNNLKNTIQKTNYISSVTGYKRTFMPHHIKAIMKHITPIIDDFFEDNLIQAKESIWK